MSKILPVIPDLKLLISFFQEGQLRVQDRWISIHDVLRIVLPGKGGPSHLWMRQFTDKSAPILDHPESVKQGYIFKGWERRSTPAATGKGIMQILNILVKTYPEVRANAIRHKELLTSCVGTSEEIENLWRDLCQDPFEEMTFPRGLPRMATWYTYLPHDPNQLSAPFKKWLENDRNPDEKGKPRLMEVQNHAGTTSNKRYLCVFGLRGKEVEVPVWLPGRYVKMLREGNDLIREYQNGMGRAKTWHLKEQSKRKLESVDSLQQVMEKFSDAPVSDKDPEPQKEEEEIQGPYMSLLSEPVSEAEIDHFYGELDQGRDEIPNSFLMLMYLGEQTER